MKRYFQRYRDDRFALTTLQNPDRERRRTFGAHHPKTSPRSKEKVTSQTQRRIRRTHLPRTPLPQVLHLPPSPQRQQIEESFLPGAVPRQSCIALASKMKPPSSATPTPSIFSHSATAISGPPSVTSSRILTGTASPAPRCSTPSAPSLTSPQTAAGSTTPANPKSCVPCSVYLPVGRFTRRGGTAGRPGDATHPHERAACRGGPVRRGLLAE
jgi:hypothetical protein